LIIAVLAALAAAFFNALAAFLEQGATKRVEGDEDVPLSQLWALARQPRWLAGQASDVTAFLVQAVALAFGSLILVEPLMVMSLPFAIALRAVFRHQRPTRRGILGSALCVGGLSLFLVVARPIPGSATVTWSRVWPVAIGLAAAVGVFLTMAFLTRDNRRAIGFALAAATFYGVTAAQVKVVTSQLRHGIGAVVTGWSVYAMIVCAIAGVLLTQNALKAGTLAAPVAVLTVGDPLVGILLGILWLGESITTTPWAITAEVIGLAVVVLGVVVLAGQSPAAAAGGDGAGSKDDRTVDTGHRRAPSSRK
jgi:uncharacterized membrane protein